MTRQPGKVYLIGAGPGDPELLTLRAARALGESDWVLVDDLVDRRVLAHVRRGATIRSVGKRAGCHSVAQWKINQMLIDGARSGRIVARLKGGDPFVYGRGGEEAEALAEAGVGWEVIPGVSAGVAAAAYAGIPVLHRARASSVAFATGHPTRAGRPLPADADTLVIFMCAATIASIARSLLLRGRAPATPVALIRAATTQRQVVYLGALGEVARLGERDLPTPLIAVVGEVAGLAGKLHWFGSPPLPLDAAGAGSGPEPPSLEAAARCEFSELPRPKPIADARHPLAGHRQEKRQGRALYPTTCYSSSPAAGASTTK
ncbi:MAG TPA: uroporphyrinogen-III C-methyltransferase [Myxococcaceae bacterium]|nr:uroporphyrinogen-III C-methyltransferase [Myxococcaceae bacterium]